MYSPFRCKTYISPARGLLAYQSTWHKSFRYFYLHGCLAFPSR
nr:MAG TPA: hypothetical protein [Caudoviricetes sp.]